MAQKCSNWSGSLVFYPDSVQRPAGEQEIAEVVAGAAREGRTVRAIGAGHSSSPLVATSDVLLSLAEFTGLAASDAAAAQASIRGGTFLREAGTLFAEAGLAMTNMGDVDLQTVVGAMATGTHGTGAQLPIMSQHMIAARVITGEGEIVSVDGEAEPEVLDALRVSLGTLGIISELRLQLVPGFQLHREELCADIDECLEHLDELAAGNRNFDFYWYPRSDEAKIRTLNPPGEDPLHTPSATLQKQMEGPAHEVIPRERDLRFDEMEYFLPRSVAPHAFREIRERIRKRWRREVAWRVLYRTVAADDSYLSGAFGRPTATISVHHNAGLPYREYFDDVEAILREYGGRPHWGKKHSLRAEELCPLYPRWDDFMKIRARFDPHGTFLTPYLRELLGQ